MQERFLYELKVKGGGLCIWGEWFGRPHDNFHIVDTVRWEKNEIILRFEEGEALYISNPMGIINEKEQLINHVVCSFSETVRWWITRHEQYTPEQIAAFFAQCVLKQCFTESKSHSLP